MSLDFDESKPRDRREAFGIVADLIRQYLADRGRTPLAELGVTCALISVKDAMQAASGIVNGPNVEGPGEPDFDPSDYERPPKRGP